MSEVFTAQKFIKDLKNGKFKNIMLLHGPEVLKETGLFDFMMSDPAILNIIKKEYEMDDPELLFDYHYFLKNPQKLCSFL